MLTLFDGQRGARRPSVVAIGVFDGLHRGHQFVLQELAGLAAHYDAAATVVTFDPSPAFVLAPDRAPAMLATLTQRLEGFALLGVDQTRVLTFDAHLASESASEFVTRVLVEELGACCVVVGEDFHFGHDRQGSVALLGEIGRERGFDVVGLTLDGAPERWSSTSVRRALGRGDLDEARRVLGRWFGLRGTVVHGDERGASLGFRTANLALAAHQQLPEEGVYAGATEIDGTWWPAAVSIGTRPQFYDEGELLVEVHVLDFTGDLYDHDLDVVFLSRLRAQATFDSVEALTSQIERDVTQTREIVEGFTPRDAQLLR